MGTTLLVILYLVFIDFINFINFVFRFVFCTAYQNVKSKRNRRITKTRIRRAKQYKRDRRNKSQIKITEIKIDKRKLLKRIRNRRENRYEN